MIGKAIYARLTVYAATSALVGTRVYPHSAPPQQKTYPLVVYRGGGDDDSATAGGGAGNVRAEVDVACIAATYAGVRALADAVKAALDDESGTWGGVVVQGVFYQRGTEQEVASADADNSLFVVEMTFTAWYQAGA